MLAQHHAFAGQCLGTHSSPRRQRHYRPSRIALQPCAVAAEATKAVGAAQQVRLGDSDLLVSECCLGTMTWGNQNTEDEAHQQLSHAFDAGVNFIDTAEMYPVPPSADKAGRTDIFISSWLKHQKREDIVLATKVSGYSRSGAVKRSNGDSTRVTPSQIQESVDKSLARLGTDHIDLLQIHWPDRYVPLFGSRACYDYAQERSDDVPFEEQLRGLEAVVAAGKVRYVGVSNETSYGVQQFCSLAQQLGLPKIVSIQNVYNLMSRVAYETNLVETCAPRQYNVGLLAYSPLAGGALSGKYITGKHPGARLNLFPGYMERYNKSLAREAVSHYAELAKKHGMTPTQLALAWCHSRPFVASTIIGATSMEQLEENLGAFDMELSEDAVADVEQINLRYRDPAIV